MRKKQGRSYRWPISTRPVSPVWSGSMRVQVDPARISGSSSDRKLNMVGEFDKAQFYAGRFDTNKRVGLGQETKHGRRVRHGPVLCGLARHE
jgi:hypothetical protein